MTQTVNAYRDMPDRVSDLHLLAGRLGDVRRANVEHHLSLLEEAARQGARVVGLGELFPAPYFALGRDPMWIALAEDAREGETVSAVRGAAKRLGLLVVAPIYERDDESGKRFNTAVVIGPEGDVLGTYRKAHIPFGENEQGGFHENLYYERSDGNNRLGPANVSRNPYFPVFATPVGRLGVAICYDPELVIADLDLAELAAGDPSGWNLPRDVRHDIYGPRP
jgi:N-carbamoylputrescine amidase